MLQISCKSVQIFRNTGTIANSNDGSSIEIIDQSHGDYAVKETVSGPIVLHTYHQVKAPGCPYKTFTTATDLMCRVQPEP